MCTQNLTNRFGLLITCNNLTSIVFSNSSKLQSLLFGLPDDLSIINDDLATLLSSALDSILLLEADDDDDDVAAAISSMRSVVILLMIICLFVCLLYRYVELSFV